MARTPVSGSPAVPKTTSGPEALCPRLTTGLPLSRRKCYSVARSRLDLMARKSSHKGYIFIRHGLGWPAGAWFGGAASGEPLATGHARTSAVGHGSPRTAEAILEIPEQAVGESRHPGCGGRRGGPAMRQSRPKAKPAVTTGPHRPNRKPSGRESGRGLRSRAGPTGNMCGRGHGRRPDQETLRQVARIGGTRVPPGVRFFYGSGNPPQVWPCTKKTGLSCLSPVTGWGGPLERVRPGTGLTD